MAEELLNVPKLTIRHYKNKSLYDSYSGSRNDGDISIIGDSMSVYSISVIDDLVSKVNANIEVNANKLKKIAESGISQFNGQIADIKANIYTKVEADRKFQLKGDYLTESNASYTYLTKYDASYTYTTKDYAERTYLKKNDIPTVNFSPYLKKTDASSIYITKYEADRNYQPKGYYLTEYEANNAYQPKGDYITESKANSRFLWGYEFKDKLLEALGVRYSIEQNGYICFGPLFGGLIIQWGNVGQYSCDIQLPIKFPTTIFGVYLGAVSPEVPQYNSEQNKLYVQEWSLYSVNNSGLSFRKIGYLGDNGKRYWVAIGK